MEFSKVFALLVLLAGSLEIVSSENILFLFPIASKSHKRAFDPLAKALAARNHQVTVVSPIPEKPQKNIRNIITNTSVFQQFGDPFKLRAEGTSGMLLRDFNFLFEACHVAYQDEHFKALFNEKFDLIFLGAMMNDCFLGVVHKLGAPFVLLVPQAAPTILTEFLGNVMPSSFVPSAMLPFRDEMSFKERLINFMLNGVLEVLSKWMMGPKFEAVYKKELGEGLPGLYELFRNASMLFMNSHFTQTFPRPLLPDVIEVGGMHCSPAKPLPKDLEEFAAGAKDGLILFSLGSIVQGNQMPESTRKVFLNVFSRLKQRVLWKWETEEMDDLPPNVKLSKWVPQQDILGHPNTIIFMTHGGLLSTQEAIYHGVPLIGIPIFGDQNLNVLQAEQGGFALSVEILEVTEESLEKTIKTMLESKTYTENAKRLSNLFKDQTETPIERAVFWSEYIIRHNGAHHLRSAARKLNAVQYHSLDVFAVLALGVLFIMWVIKVITVRVYKKLFGSNKTDVVKKIKKK